MSLCYGESNRKRKCVPLNNSAKKVCFNEKVNNCSTPGNSKEFTMANFPSHLFHIGVDIRFGEYISKTNSGAYSERVLLNGENLDQLRDSYELVLKYVKNKLLTYTLSEYVTAEVDRLPEIDSFYYDVDSPHGLHELFESLIMSIEPIYKNPENPASFGGVNALYRALDNHVKTKLIRQWLETKDSYTLYKPARRRFKRNRVLVGGMEEQFQADLLDLQSLKSVQQWL
ncbi:uncharacterized transposon-derived protein F54H12.3 [Trichonephila clavipes]|nr:uncharacterized transposon-derived protein F54H12.3 [Trichonephila clavipes]